MEKLRNSREQGSETMWLFGIIITVMGIMNYLMGDKRQNEEGKKIYKLINKEDRIIAKK